MAVHATNTMSSLASDTMLSFVRIDLLNNWRSAVPSYRPTTCPWCRWDTSCLQYGPSVKLCHNCFKDCGILCQAARVCQRAQKLPEATSCDTQSPMHIARRIAFLRALPFMKFITVPGVCGLCPSLCIWCDEQVDIGYETSTKVEWDPLACDKIGGPRHQRHSTRDGWRLHEDCRESIQRHLRSTHLKLCVASCALWLPLLPETTRQIAAIVCQLTADGLEAAAAIDCPTTSRASIP